MAAISAELYVPDYGFTVTHCRFGITQATQLRGRVSAPVRYELVQLVLNVPDGDMLPVWAVAPYQRLATAIVFRDATGGQPVETLHLPAAYCVAYKEQFVSGDTQSGSYQCFLTLADPTGWTLTPGGLASAFVAQAGHSQGEPGAGATAVSSALPPSQAIASSSSPSPMDLDMDLDSDPEEVDEMLKNPERKDLIKDSDRAQLSGDPDLQELFKNKDLLRMLRNMKEGNLPRLHKDIISMWEQAVIAYYTMAEGYRELNAALRGQDPMTEFLRTQERILNGALGKLPKFQGLTMRGVGESETQRLDNANEGDVIEYKNFISASTEGYIADEYMNRGDGKYLLRITSKTSVQIGEMSMVEGDEEVLFKSRTKFRVTDKRDRPRFSEDDPFVKEVYLEEI